MAPTEDQRANRDALRNLRALQKGIDVGKRVVTATHDFEFKLHDAQGVIYYLLSKFGGHGAIKDLLESVLAEVRGLINALQMERKGFLRIVLEEQAEEKKMRRVVFKFRKEEQYDERGRWLRKKRIEENEADQVLIQVYHGYFERMKSLFERGEHIFVADLEKAQIKQVKVELGVAEKSFKKFMEGLLGYFVVYEKILREASEELKD